MRDCRRDFFTTLPFFLLLLGDLGDLALTSSALENLVFVSGVRVGVMVITLWRWIWSVLRDRVTGTAGAIRVMGAEVVEERGWSDRLEEGTELGGLVGLVGEGEGTGVVRWES